MSRGKIIVVEDERDIREGLCELLVRDGYDVTACGSVQEAERSIAGGGVGLYLLDVMLPDGSGFVLCEYIRGELGSDAPVIFLTALDDEDSVVKGLRWAEMITLGSRSGRESLWRESERILTDTIRAVKHTEPVIWCMIRRREECLSVDRSWSLEGTSLSFSVFLRKIRVFLYRVRDFLSLCGILTASSWMTIHCRWR